MNKLIISIVTIFVLASCASERTAEVVKGELQQTKTELKSLQSQEMALQMELDSLTGGKVERATMVRIENLQPKHFEHQIELSGAVEAQNSAYISPESGGQVKRILVKEGQRISKGQLMISLNSQPLRSQLAELKNGHELAEIIFEKQKGLWEQKIGSEVQFLEAKNNKESLESKIKSVEAQIAMAEIRAPFSGIVDEIYPKVGELASPGQRMVDLVSLKKMEILAEVSEAYLQNIKIGDKVEVEFPNYTEGNMTSKIQRMGNIINPSNRTFRIVVPINNDKEHIKPNQIAALHLCDYQTDSALIVPSIIIRKDLKGSFLFITSQKEGKMIAKKTYIKTGMSYKGITEVLEGVLPNQNVIVDGYNLVRNGTSVEIAN